MWHEMVGCIGSHEQLKETWHVPMKLLVMTLVARASKFGLLNLLHNAAVAVAAGFPEVVVIRRRLGQLSLHQQNASVLPFRLHELSRQE